MSVLSARGHLCSQKTRKLEFCELDKQHEVQFNTTVHRNEGTVNNMHLFMELATDKGFEFYSNELSQLCTEESMCLTEDMRELFKNRTLEYSHFCFCSLVTVQWPGPMRAGNGRGGQRARKRSGS